MINKTEWNRMMEGKLYNPYKLVIIRLKTFMQLKKV